MPPKPPEQKPDLLREYRDKRDAAETPEPFGDTEAERPGVFVVHQHLASREHYDLRLEKDNVLLSWAVPKGFSFDPKDKRLAVQTEPHPIEYADFEGVIPSGNYGAGEMIIWDKGHWVEIPDPDYGLEKGKLKFELHGWKLRGLFTLIKTARGTREWLLFKKPDAYASGAWVYDQDATSVVSGLTALELRQGSTRAADFRAELTRLNVPRGRVEISETQVMLAETADGPFSDPAWLFELKYDGFRVLLSRDSDGRPRLFYRSGREATDAFPELARVLASQPYDNLIVDAEVVCLDHNARPDIHRLQKRVHRRRTIDLERAAVEYPATLYAFDILGFEDFDLRTLPLVERKRLLKLVLPSNGPLRYSDHVEERGEELFAQIKAMDLEGVMAKRASSSYQAGRSADWKKVVFDRTGDFVIVGFTWPKNSRTGLGGLHLAVYEDGQFHYAGRVGSGFSDRLLNELREALDSIVVEDPMVVGELPVRPDQVWVRPLLVCEVRFKEWSPALHLRLPVFLRLRHDKKPEECSRTGMARSTAALPTVEGPPEPAEPAAKVVKYSNRKKVFWPDAGYTKGDLIAYYQSIAGYILPYLADRPMVMTRFPDGIDGKSFYQKNTPGFLPDWVTRIQMWANHSKRHIDYMIADCVETLSYVANSGSIPIHIWMTRASALDKPTWCLIDLDPKEAPFSDVVTLAQGVGALCKKIGLPAYPKTSGATGIHILIPLGEQLNYEQVRMLGTLIARVVIVDYPELATTERVISRRDGKVYFDILQNAHGQLMVSPYCVRPRPGAPVSTPLLWSEVTQELSPADYTIRTVPKRLQRLGADPMLPVLTEKPDLLVVLQKLAALIDD